MPEAYQLNHNLPVFILVVGQNKVRDHHRVSQQEHLTLAGELPVSSFISHLLLEFARKVLLQAAVERATLLELSPQGRGVIKPLVCGLPCLSRLGCCDQPPLLSEPHPLE